MQFLNLLLHYPGTIDRFRDQQWHLIVSDPDMVAIIKTVMEQVKDSEDVANLEGFLEGEEPRQQLRVALLSQPFYAVEMVESAVAEFQKKIAKCKISQSISRAKAEGDIEMLNRLIKAKQDLD
jgi:hypothetical protein